MKRPLLFILIFLILGILIGNFINGFLVIVLFFVLLLISLYLSKLYKIKFPKYLILFTLLGYYLIYLNNTTYNLKEKDKINAIGYVKNIENTSNNKYKFILKTVSINNKNENLNILVYTDNLNNIKYGAKISINGTIYYPNKKSNPNSYDEELNFKINDITYKMYAENINILKYNKFKLYLSNLKDNICNIYDDILPITESNILKAMILGEKQFLDNNTIDLYKTSGIYHILAISGLHIATLSIFLTKLFKLLYNRFRYILVIIVLIFYCIFTGASLSTVRATIMCITVLIGHMIYRSLDFISSISLSAIILLIKNPYYIFDIGFLYSYTSVFSIAFLGGRICQLYNLKGIFKSFIISFFVCLSIKPITAYYFYNITILDTLLNIIIIPFMSIVIIIGFLTTIIGIFSIPLSKFLIGSVYYILRFFTYICKVVENMNFNNILIGKPSIFVILGLYIMLIFIAYAFYDKYLLRKRKKFINIGMIIFIISMFLSSFIPKPFNITMLDIGQGDSIVGINNNSTFLIDGGGNKSYSVGENIILPYLKSKGIKSLDFVFVTHNDTDHIKGIIEILDKINIKNLFLPLNNTIDENYKNLLITAKNENIPIYFLQAGDKLILDKNIEFDILHPNKNFYNKDDNNNSIVLKLKYKNHSILFTGDIEKEAEKFLVDNNLNLSANILKIAHHGSKTSTTKEFLNKVNPNIALISCKKDNIYNHPSEETINILTENNIYIYRTDKNKAISINFYKNKYKIKCIENTSWER
ncbi:DNA internalization-related competence protein ComEC/Rec2 [[Clostridium] colinum]|uniref:DNA internalization-related competence protein ComEC/Rec2 n=1 Tax=[Clostridium] colinum TaxID=36835 RepID=UPI002025040A|nr:DNA internalization-related competence protein ComEC/Rec2 [[Clostridium] colinum]